MTIQLYHVKISAKSNKGQENQTKLDFVIDSSLKCLSKHRNRPLLIATEKPMRLFGPKTSQKSSETRKLNGNIFIELFLSDLDEKITSASSKRERNEKQTGTVRRANNLFTFLTA